MRQGSTGEPHNFRNLKQVSLILCLANLEGSSLRDTKASYKEGKGLKIFTSQVLHNARAEGENNNPLCVESKVMLQGQMLQNGNKQSIDM